MCSTIPDIWNFENLEFCVLELAIFNICEFQIMKHWQCKNLTFWEVKMYLNNLTFLKTWHLWKNVISWYKLWWHNIFELIDYQRLMVHGSRLMSQGPWLMAKRNLALAPKTWGAQRQIIFLGHEPWATSLEAWAMRLEPWAMDH